MTTVFVERLVQARVLGIVRGADTAAAVDAALALFSAGITLVEVSLTTVGALEVVRVVRDRAPSGCQVGAGTVLTERQARQAADAGAEFVLTPAVTPSVAAAARLGLPVVAGAFTPTEAWHAVDQGACAVKLFPASVGGPGHLRSLRDPLPHISFVPVGGVGLDHVRAYLDAGAIAVGVGSPLLGDAASGGDLDRLRDRARAYLDAARPAVDQ